MFVLGIDPGLTTTGYGIIEDRRSEQRAVAAGVLRTDPDASTAERLVEMHRDLSSLIAEHRPDAAAIERVFVNRNLKTAMTVARASGVALLAAAQAGLAIAEYTPSAVKMALAGFGAAPKEQVQRVVAMRLRLASPPEVADAADALAVALCHVQSVRMERNLERAT
ncbi:MAG: crossover junction endodeoxyribonuclease RuvC [Acidimicrobiia bacterium]